jgi:hypothetical protein
VAQSQVPPSGITNHCTGAQTTAPRDLNRSIESAAFNAYHHIIENTASPDFILDENGNKVWENDRISGISSYKELKVLAEIDR